MRRPESSCICGPTYHGAELAGGLERGGSGVSRLFHGDHLSTGFSAAVGGIFWSGYRRKAEAWAGMPFRAVVGLNGIVSTRKVISDYNLSLWALLLGHAQRGVTCPLPPLSTVR